MDDVVCQALDAARLQLGMDIGYFSEFVGEEQVICAVEGDPSSFGLEPGTRVPLADSYCQRVVDGRLSSLVPDTADDPITRDLATTASAGIGAYVGVPLELPDGRLFGTLCAASSTRRPHLGKRDLAFVRVLARLLAEHLQRRADEERHAAELAAANAELEAFAQIVAHDLSEPVRTVRQLVGHLERTDRDAEILEFVRREAERMERLVHGLLELARAGGEVRFGDVELEDAAAHALSALRGAVEERGARIDVGPLPRVRGDATQLGQVLQNLIANALVHTGEAPPHVEVLAERLDEDDLVVVSVVDNGPGVAPNDRERIFRPLERGTESAGTRGSGIGLATCAKVVERHGGRLWVEDAPGGGSRFAFTVPASPPS